MQKIPSLFKRDYEGNRQVYNEVVPGSEWVLDGKGIPTRKIDGTCCKIENSALYKRYDRKLSKNAMRKLKKGDYAPKNKDYKLAPEGWKAAELEPNHHTGHWPGWLPISEDAPDDKWHREAWKNCLQWNEIEEGTYELVGPKIQGNPYKLDHHVLHKHGDINLETIHYVPRDFEGLNQYLKDHCDIEGIVWHHPDGRMVKIKRRDFGYEWPVA